MAKLMFPTGGKAAVTEGLAMLKSSMVVPAVP